MAGTAFIQVIVPLRLEWDPCYTLEGAAVGQRVRVMFAHREYVGVVSAVNVNPATDPERVQAALPTDLPAVNPQEIAFWRALAGYYLCTVGEVYKAAYPVLKQESDAVQLRTTERLQKRLALLREKIDKARKEETRERYAGEIARLEAFQEVVQPAREMGSIVLSPAQEKAAGAIRKGLSSGKTVLLHAHAGKTEIYLQLAQEVLRSGKTVLYLVPEIGLFRQLEAQVAKVFPRPLLYHSARSAAQKRAVADAVREGKPELVLGTRSALFLPLRNLGLIILDQEHETSYKQDSPAPRYHARESAILLAGIHRAKVLLGSATPSLESIYNAETGLFTMVHLEDGISMNDKPGILLLNTAAEARKKGMVGSFSLKLLEQMHRTLDEGEKLLVVCRSKAAVPEAKAELEAVFGPALRAFTLATPASAKDLPSASFGLVAILQADGMLARDDFRCDERAHQLLSLLESKCTRGGRFVVQTRESAHPVFGGYSAERIRQLLEERRQFGYPPYARLIHVSVKDNNEKRGNYMAAQLAQALGRIMPGVVCGGLLIRILLPRDKALLSRKQALQATVSDFEKARKYPGHIIVDVDPV